MVPKISVKIKAQVNFCVNNFVKYTGGGGGSTTFSELIEPSNPKIRFKMNSFLTLCGSSKDLSRSS